jgi:hypothetical protein
MVTTSAMRQVLRRARDSAVEAAKSSPLGPHLRKLVHTLRPYFAGLQDQQTPLLIIIEHRKPRRGFVAVSDDRMAGLVVLKTPKPQR